MDDGWLVGGKLLASCFAPEGCQEREIFVKVRPLTTAKKDNSLLMSNDSKFKTFQNSKL